MWLEFRKREGEEGYFITEQSLRRIEAEDRKAAAFLARLEAQRKVADDDKSQD